jgi:hypothetical protein
MAQKPKNLNETNFGYERIDYQTDGNYYVYNGAQYLGIAQRVSRTRVMQWSGCGLFGENHFARTRSKLSNILLAEANKTVEIDFDKIEPVPF